MEHSLIQNADLSSFVVANVRLTGRELGRGAYGSVVEVEIPGAVCAAKKIHDELLRIGGSKDVRHMVEAFVRECRLMSTLRHPHVVQFIGVCYLAGSTLPSLIMERLDTSLHEMLESVPDIALTTKLSVLLDVARGLLYLHGQTPPIIHRDLTARNVLLNYSSLVAKITDMGVARIVSLQSNQLAATMTQGPGNIIYMPPEAMGLHSRYSTSLDIFSFGNLALFTLTQQFPNLLAATYNDPMSDKVIGRTEIERRSNEFQLADSLLGLNSPVVELARSCLQNRQTSRPTASQLVQQLTDMLPSSIPSRLDLEKEIADEKKKRKTLQDNNIALKRDVDYLQEEIANKHSLLAEQLEEQRRKDEQLLELQRQLESQRHEIKHVEEELDELVLQGTIPREEARSLQRDVAKMKPNEQELEFLVSFEWKKESEMPAAVSRTSSPVVVNGKVYFEANTLIIYEYTSDSHSWIELPRPPGYMYGITALSKKLALIGDKAVSIWSSETKKWTKYNNAGIPTARTCPAVTGYEHYVIVAGGVPERNIQSTTAVEILDTTSGKWYAAPPMPYNGLEIQSVIIGQYLYLHLRLRGALTLSKSMLRVSLPILLSNAMSGRNRDASVWEKLPSLPFCRGAPFCIGNMLLTAGGTPSGSAGTAMSALKIKSYKVVTDIHLFNPHTNQWVKVGDLPKPYFNFSCIYISPGKILVTGGEIDLGKYSSAVHTATIGRFHF